MYVCPVRVWQDSLRKRLQHIRYVGGKGATTMYQWPVVDIAIVKISCKE